MPILSNYHIHILQDQSIKIMFKGQPLQLTGYDHPWGPGSLPSPALECNHLHLALSHTPDNIYQLSKAHVDSVFSGHYHAGQFRVPVVGSIIIPSKYGRRFEHGHYQVNNTHLFIPSGIGASNPPLRIYCQPDLFMIDVNPAS